MYLYHESFVYIIRSKFCLFSEWFICSSIILTWRILKWVGVLYAGLFDVCLICFIRLECNYQFFCAHWLSIAPLVCPLFLFIQTGMAMDLWDLLKQFGFDFWSQKLMQLNGYRNVLSELMYFGFLWEESGFLILMISPVGDKRNMKEYIKIFMIQNLILLVCSKLQSNVLCSILRIN